MDFLNQIYLTVASIITACIFAVALSAMGHVWLTLAAFSVVALGLFALYDLNKAIEGK